MNKRTLFIVPVILILSIGCSLISQAGTTNPEEPSESFQQEKNDESPFASPLAKQIFDEYLSGISLADDFSELSLFETLQANAGIQVYDGDYIFMSSYSNKKILTFKIFDQQISLIATSESFPYQITYLELVNNFFNCPFSRWVNDY